MKTERELHLMDTIIKGSNYPLDKIEAHPTKVRAKYIIEHAYEVGYLTEDQFNKLRAVFVGN
ncbi:hypothetical protein ACLNAR_26445 [Priestia aryabhattai]|uniref:hypothetical protein n=1 Tax=Priestia aryabhattai TaxID=412384 RepID=UPI00398F4237